MMRGSMDHGQAAVPGELMRDGGGHAPAGRWWVWRRLDRPVLGRLYAAVVLGVVVGAVVVAAWVTPAPAGMGTHQQLGLHPCGFVVMTGLPCPTCGMTTAFAWTVRGRLIAAFKAQVAGTLIALAMLTVGLLAGVALVAGRYPGIDWVRVDPVRVLWVVTLVCLLAWVGKVVAGLLSGTLPAR